VDLCQVRLLRRFLGAQELAGVGAQEIVQSVARRPADLLKKADLNKFVQAGPGFMGRWRALRKLGG
jgi:hypothetical protein